MGLACRLSALGLLLSALLVCTRSQDQEFVFAIVGEDFTFSPKVNGTISEITWMKRKNKVAEWEHDKSPTYFSSLAERGKLETSSGNLTIKKLNTDDAAEYEAQVLPVGNDLLQYTKFVLEVLDPPSPSVLNCSVTNGQIRISCEIHFSKDVRYSWYRDDRKIIQASNPVLELKENADRQEKVLCVREVSKTKINNSISLSACFPKSAESLSRDRNGLIAFFVILLLFMGALFVLWKRGLLSNIVRQRSRKNSDEARNLEEIEQGVRASHNSVNESQDEARNLEEIEQDEARKLLQTEQDLRASHNSVNESQGPATAVLDSGNNNVAGAASDEEKNSKETESTRQADLSSNQENPEEKKNSKETESMSQADDSSNQENPGPATAVLDSGNNNVAGAASDEEKNSEETESMNQPDPPSNQEKTEEKKNSKETMSVSQADSSSNQENPDEEKNSEETESMNQPDPPSNQEKTDEEKNSSLNQ